jgi:hypothetical protein
MALDYDAILDKFILVAQEALPTGLSLIGVGGNLPAVIRARQEGSKPDYPYATIDVLDTVDESGWLYSETINSNDETVYETNKQLLLNYRVYGGNAVSIAQKLHGFFRLNRVLGDIRNTLGGSVVTVDDVDQLPILLADTYLESASFNIIFNITDTFIDTLGSDSFTTIHLDGTIFDISTDDPNPLDVDIIVPTP